ncbi:MAG TPA: glutathione S-transferase family protein [Gammaproteobacteria bacterium]|nr:glutathione S-transferase family protein [Gammaproteobacteria bacterium]
MMRLFITVNSPYARIVRVAAIEAGLDGDMDIEVVTVRDPRSALLPFNPAGKVPTLRTDSGDCLSETRIILEHLDTLHAGEKLLADTRDLAGRADEGRIFGCLDGVATWAREYRRPEPRRFVWLMEVEHARAARCFDLFDSSRDLLSGRVRVAQIALGCTVGFVDAFLHDFDWRDGRPILSAWYDEFAKRPSMQATMPERIVR